MARYSPEATEKKRLRNFEKWLAAAVAKHRDQFDYKLAESTFTTQNESVALICKKHCITFEATAFDHLRFDGGGCTLCGNERKADAKRRDGEATFLAKFNESLSDRLELTSAYLGMHEPITVRCKVHGTSKSTTPNLLTYADAYGCDECSRKASTAGLRWDLESLKEKFGPLMPSHVAIDSLIQEPGKATKVVVDCEVHGKNPVLVGYLTRSNQGKSYYCPRCGDEQAGYAGHRLKRLLERGESGKPTWLAVMEVEPFGIRTLKVGISTRSLNDRYGPALKTLHFTVRVAEREALLLENEVHRIFRAKHDRRVQLAGIRNRKRWAGDTECYWLDAKPVIVAHLKKRVADVEAGRFNLEEAVGAFVEPDFSERDVSRPAGEFQGPVAVVCLDTGETFESVKAAARATGCSAGNLSSVLNGLRRHAGGKRWVYATDYDPSVPVPPIRPKNVPTRKVLCVDDGRVFDSLVEAGAAYNISSSHITSVCKGKRKRAGKKMWRYVEDGETSSISGTSAAQKD